jgi:ABC-type antimicrobial peptide transport system ATPase subunit
MPDQPAKPLLEFQNLKTYFYTKDGVVKAVDGVDFTVFPGEVLQIHQNMSKEVSPIPWVACWLVE